MVDNNSRDETKAVVEQYQATWRRWLRCIFEGSQGLKHARKRALREAPADIISYIDDDVGWLSAVAAAFEEHGAAVVGAELWRREPPLAGIRGRSFLGRRDDQTCHGVAGPLVLA